MFDNIGGKIQMVAIISFIAGIISSVICAFEFGRVPTYSYYYSSKEYTYTAVFWMFLILGPIVSYLNSLVLYGFGELIEKTSQTKELLERMKKDIATSVNPHQKEQDEIARALKF